MTRARTVIWAFAMVSLGTAACGIEVGPPQAPREPISPEIQGPILAAPGDGPPVECRGLAADRCRSVGAIEDGVGGVDLAEVERVVVSCESAPCTDAGGAFRIDVVLVSGEVTEIGRGGYGEFEQP